MLSRLLYPPNSILKRCFLISDLDNLFGRAQWMKIGTKTLVSNVVYSSPIGSPGSGVGKGGGGGGSIKEAGGGLGQYGAAREEQFFFNKQREQLEKLKEKLKDTESEDLTRKEK